MPTANERKALWFLALVALSGGGMRLWRAAEPPNVGATNAAIERQIRRADSAREARKKGQGKRPGRARKARDTVARGDSTRAQPVDLDHASSAEIETLPGVGPSLAARIVSYRDSIGGFGSIDRFCEVRGIGPALAKKLRPLVTFSGAPSPVSVACGEASRTSRKTRPSRAPDLR